MRKLVKAIGAGLAALALVGVAVFYAASANAMVTDPTDTCTPGQTSDGCGGPADDGPPPHMDDQDDDGSDGTATPPPPELDSLSDALVDVVRDVDARLRVILGQISKQPSGR
jgi:hypothetical protein